LSTKLKNKYFHSGRCWIQWIFSLPFHTQSNNEIVLTNVGTIKEWKWIVLTNVGTIKEWKCFSSKGDIGLKKEIYKSVEGATKII